MYFEFILGARPRNDSGTVKEAILSLNLKDGEVRVIERGDGTRMVVSVSYHPEKLILGVPMRKTG